MKDTKMSNDVWLYSHSTKIDGNDQAAGRSAARDVFAFRQAEPGECHAAHRAVVDFDGISGDALPTQIQLRAAIWNEAENAAIIAATQGWARIPEDLSLGLA